MSNLYPSDSQFQQGQATTATTAPTDALNSAAAAASGSKGSTSEFGFTDLMAKARVVVGSLLEPSMGQFQGSPDAVMAAFAHAPASTVAQIQQYLLLGGFYPANYQPSYGVLRPQDVAAFRNAVEVSVHTGSNLSTYLRNAALIGQQSGQGQGGDQAKQAAVRNIETTNPADLNAALDAAFRQALGRQATPEEKGRFVASYQASERAYQQAAYDAQDAAAKAAASAAANPDFPPIPDLFNSLNGQATGAARSVAANSGHLTGEDRAALRAETGSPLGYNTAQPLTVQQAISLASAAGFQGQSLVTAVAIAMAESSLNPSSVGNNNDGSIDRGVWQINNRWHPEVSDQAAFNPSSNAAAAFRISGGGHSFGPWSTYNSGAYRKFVPLVQAALGQPVDLSGVHKQEPITLNRTQPPSAAAAAEAEAQKHPEEAYAKKFLGTEQTFEQSLAGPGGP